MVTEELTREGRGEGIGDPSFRATFWVMVKFTGVVTVLRTLGICQYGISETSRELTAATTFKFPPVAQL
jgi:hypothetical protein